MRKKLRSFLFLVLLSSGAQAQTLLHYWNFNNTSSLEAHLTPVSILDGASIKHIAGGTSAIAEKEGTGQGFDRENLNARNGDPAGNHLRFNNPIGGALLFHIPTTGFRNILIKYVSMRSGSGAGTQLIEYTTNGTDYTPFTTIAPNNGTPQLETLDFSGIAAANNNDNFKIRISFEQEAGGLVGNNRFDNFTVEGEQAGADVLPPSLTFSPAANAVHVAVDVHPSITFNEDVRLRDNTAITNNNVANLVEFKLQDAQGTAIAYSATFADRTITIIPATSLAPNQTYYIALKADVVEDFSDNAVETSPSFTFTTIAQQTQFQPGDLLFVAYRMNATGTEDEVAFITLVDILPGTMVHFTDAKYTDNTQPQCEGGLTWVAPATGIAAGTVIRIQNDVPSTSHGTVYGSKFGLSSGGDQVLVYTGTPQNPSYITALSSNAWVEANTSCSGSLSKLPASLTLGHHAISLSGAPGNTAGNTANAFYKGRTTGTKAELQAAILMPENWEGTASGTAAQRWPEWAFPGPPAVASARVLNQNTLELAFNKELAAASAAMLANYTGIDGLQSALLADDAKTVTLLFSTAFASGATYTLQVAGVKDKEDRVMHSAYTFSFTYNTTISFATKFLSVSESAGTAEVTINIENPAEATAKLVLKAAPFSTATASDFTFSTQSIQLTGASGTSHTLSIPIINDTEEEQDEYFVLSLEDITGATLTGSQYLTIYIRDNDRKATQPNQEIRLAHVSSFEPVGANGSTTEIVVHDPASQRLFMTSSVQNRLDIADFSNPAAITLIKSIDMAPYGGITSVAVRDGIVAVASPNADEQQNGSVIFMNTNGDVQAQVTVGALPDMVTFTPDGTKVLTANEGQPNDAYTIDPEGSISIIDISGGIANLGQAHVTTLLFTAYNEQEAALMAAGVRKTKSTSTLSQDLEPEYISVSPDSRKAWVTLQENNAIAELNLETKSITAIWPLGTKDMSALGNGFDASDNSGVVHLSNWPIKSFYIPDGVANYTVGSTTYLVTANEGDEKEYGSLNERTTVGAATLDQAKFPHAAVLKDNHNLGRLRITNLHGDTDGDGDLDELYMLGSRSFSIWNAETKELVYDSGDDFELYTSTEPSIASLFNSDHEGNGFKSRSRAKGPEPENVTVATIDGAVYAFVALERVGGVMVYNISDPANVKFVDYLNTRNTATYAGDHGPEGIIYIMAQNSPDGKPYIAVANEISGTVSVFEVQKTITSAKGEVLATKQNFHLYPNPATGKEVFFSKQVDVQVLDVTGKLLFTGTALKSIDISGFKTGLYFVRTSEGAVRRLVVK
ncbi:choice-of-anchor I family protein [Pontibacter sp. SGAir0037]|uniref:choice-of-anchor I family protein n=1 Tax=Pontibacter sp. SGAir0037 TaxID=2571030 RepID=UPI0010CD3EF4|nr:choice-of-anchor I family protein [Pontibacter sp. SGAir0037]QCR21990.1 hypothetical protein C1N53_06325 [Pontibacter sp. SGAir0037]